VGVHLGNYSAGVLWDYVHQDEWLIAHDVLVTGNLEFWSYAYQGSIHQDHYYVKISLDGGNSWTTLLDLSALPPYPSPNGYNQWENPYSVDLGAYQGEVASIAWEAVDGDGLGLWYSWGIDNCMIGGKKLTTVADGAGGEGTVVKSPEALLGYNIFRKDPGATDFLKVNLNSISDTVYTDHGLSAGLYEYFIHPLFNECEETLNSDTIQADVITSVATPGARHFRVFPVPAHGRVSVESADPIRVVDLMNTGGSLVATFPGSGSGRMNLDISPFPPGVYFLRVISDMEIRVAKIIVL